jgi:prepilin-type N-terminal cleavage/methylation domain-containing protein
MSLPSNTSRRSRGFTLVELVIVLAVMLLLVIATLPRVKYALDESKVRESSRQLNSYIAMAKSRASSTGRPCGVWFVSDVVGDPTATPYSSPPAVFQSTQLFLAEIPPPYTGDILDSRVVVRDGMGMGFATANNGPNWRLDFLNGPGSLLTLVNQGDSFGIRFDHKGPIFLAERFANNEFYITSRYTNLSPTIPIVPPVATGDLGYSFEIIRFPQRIGAPLALPRGTSIDLSYSGFGNGGREFQVATSHVLVMFSPDGHVFNASIGTTDSMGNAVVITDDAPGTIHFLVGRPEKVLNNVGAPFGANTNIIDNKALWVSVGRLTGSVISTENAPDANFVFTTPATPAVQAQEQQAYLTFAREFAITQDVKGGR